MKVSLIAAMGKSGQIGLNGSIPFKSDLKRFKWLTMGKTVIMGRKTYESIGSPLPGRQNIVLTSKTNFAPENVFVVHSVKEALDLGHLLQRELMVCGGQRVYEDFLQHADRLYITEVDYIGKADTYFPHNTIKNGKWSVTFREKKFTILDRIL